MCPIALVEQKSLELKKHVGLIHSTNKLSLLERKIANALLYNAYESLQKENEHQIHIPSLCLLIGYNSKDYKTIKKALISLISTVLEWNLLDRDSKDDSGIWMASAMLSDAKIEGAICTYSYSNRMRELCYYPEFYGRLNMNVLSLFKSTYGLALYENCMRYQNISQTPWFDLTIYRKLMGISSDKYPIFRDFNKRVIQPSIKEVNNYAPIHIKPEFKKEGRVVTALRFQISKQIQKVVINQIEESNMDCTVRDRLCDNYGLSAAQAKSFLDKFGKEYLLEKMSLIEASLSYQQGKIKHLAKYLEKALIEDYQPPKSSKDNLENLRLKREKDEKIRKLREQNMCKYREYQLSEIPNIYRILPEKEKTKIMKEFDKHISTTVYASVYAKDGLDNPLVRDRFGDFIRANHVELLANLLSFEDFCKRENL